MRIENVKWRDKRFAFMIEIIHWAWTSISSSLKYCYEKKFCCNRFHQINDMLYLTSVQIENALFLFSFTNLIKFGFISECIFILFPLRCDYLYIEFSQWICAASVILWAYIKNTKLEGFDKILPNMCLFLFFCIY
jgi:hypothetical protein